MKIILIIIILLLKVTTADLNIKNITPGGLIFEHVGSVTLHGGDHHVHINTNLNISATITEICNMENTFNNTCTYLQQKDLPNSYCWTLSKELNEETQVLKQFVRSFDTFDLEKRTNSQVKSSLEGIFPWLSDVFIGKNDIETPISDDIIHTQQTIDSFNTVKGQIIGRKGVLNNQLNEMKNAGLLKHQTDGIQRYILSLMAIMRSHLSQIKMSFDLTGRALWQSNEIKITRDKIKMNNGDFTNLPDISLQELIQSSKSKLITVDGELIVEITIPLVYPDRYEEFAIYAVPINNSIIKTSKKTIVVNQKNSMFFYPPENSKIIQLSTSLKMMDNELVFKAETTEDCIARAILPIPSELSCELIPLKTPYDMWIPMNGHNTVLFYSSHHLAYQFCPKRRENIIQQSGIIKIPSGCYIESKTTLIYSSSDMTTVQHHQYLVKPPLKIDTIMIDQPKLTKNKQLNQSKVNISSMGWIGIIGLNVIIGGIAIISTLLVLVCWLKCRKTTVEMMELRPVGSRQHQKIINEEQRLV